MVFRLRKKLLFLVFLLITTLSLQACNTVRGDDRIALGTVGGACIGTGVAIASGGSVLPGIAGGAAIGAILGFLSD